MRFVCDAHARGKVVKGARIADEAWLLGEAGLQEVSAEFRGPSSVSSASGSQTAAGRTLANPAIEDDARKCSAG
jgi:hypothetical protein